MINVRYVYICIIDKSSDSILSMSTDTGDGAGAAGAAGAVWLFEPPYKNLPQESKDRYASSRPDGRELASLWLTNRKLINGNLQ